ncbi:MAG: hypothetical protein N4A33_08420 [Bacteriovoracaceae bacterium]|jgi:ubiquinone biosynthesis protein UbiJ|nr:hypothetical protein [Bacteriovoracaceae bacterium]
MKKKLLVKSFMGALALTIAAQTTPNAGLLIANANASVDMTMDEVVVVDKVALIKSAFQNFKKNVDYKLMSPNDAITQFTMTMFDNKVTEQDMAEFVRVHADSTAVYQNYLMAIEQAKANLEGEDFSPEEFGVIAGSSLGMLDQEALKWSGCAGLGIGVVLIIGAVVMGVIALVKSEGEASIKGRFAERKRQLDRNYQDAVNFINDAENRIQGEINAAQNEINLINEEIDQAQSDLAYWNGQVTAALNAGDLEGAQIANDNVTAIQNQIEQYQADIVAIQGDISSLMIELDNYNTPGYKEQLIAQETATYESDSALLEDELQTELSLVPVEKARAKKLGIAAGVSAALGIYLAIDGSQDC